MESEEWCKVMGTTLAEECDFDIITINQVFRASLIATLDTLRSKGVINSELTIADLIDPLLTNPTVKH